MLTLVAWIWFDSSFIVGDHWTTERTMRLLQEPDHVDSKSIDRLEYRITEAGQERTILSVKTTSTGDVKTPPHTEEYGFKPNGVLVGLEPSLEPNLERINRMVWTALEVRNGLSWSRKWPIIGGLPPANVIVRPTSKTSELITMSVTYQENDITKGVATVKVFANAHIVNDLSLTINSVPIPGHVKPGSLVVTEKLKELHLKPR